MEAQSRVPLLLLYIFHCQQYETQSGQCVQCPTFLSHFNQIWSSKTDFRKRPFTTICPLGVALIPADTRTYGRDETNGRLPRLTQIHLKFLALNDDLVSHSIQNNTHDIRTSCNAICTVGAALIRGQTDRHDEASSHFLLFMRKHIRRRPTI